MPFKTLVLLAHPDLATSRVNRALADTVRDVPGVTVRDLANFRGPGGFDTATEQRLLLEHDTVVLLFPWYWYSVPGILKEWMDQVLTYGFAYGANGTALHGKTLQVVTSTGGPAETYGPHGYNRFTMEQLFTPLLATAHLCGLEMAEPLVLHGARTASDEDVALQAKRYQELLRR